MHTQLRYVHQEGMQTKTYLTNGSLFVDLLGGEWCCAPCFVVQNGQQLQNGCALHLLDSTKWLHTPRVVLMLHVLLESTCNSFCKKRLVEPTSHLVDLYKIKRIFKRRGNYKMGWLNPALTKRWKIILFCTRHHFYRGNWKGDTNVFF